MKKAIRYLMSLAVAMTLFMGANTAFAYDYGYHFTDIGDARLGFHVQILADKGVINGYPDGTFRPTNPINRAEASKVIWNAVELAEIYTERNALTRPLQNFPDVKETDWFAPHVENMYKFKLIDGYQDGTFRPQDNMTRAEAAKLIAETFYTSKLEAENYFKDVPENAWYAHYVNSLKEAGFSEVTDGNFRPNDKITRAELSFYVAEALNWYMEGGYEYKEEVEVPVVEEEKYVHPVYPQSYDLLKEYIERRQPLAIYSYSEVYDYRTKEVDTDSISSLIEEILTEDSQRYNVVDWTVNDDTTVNFTYK